MAEVLEEKTTEEVQLPTMDQMMENVDFKKAFNSLVDSGVSKGVMAYKDGNFTDAVNKAANDKIEQSKLKTPDQLRIEEMAKTVAELKQAAITAEQNTAIEHNKALALKGLSEKGLPAGLSDYVTADTEENTVKRLDSMANVISEYVQGIKADGLKNNNTTVPYKESLASGALKIPAADASEAVWETYFSEKKKLDK